MSNNFLAICDCGLNALDGQWEVKDQRDWTVPEFKDEDLKELCENTACDENCEHCVVSRIREAVFEFQY